MPSPRILLVLTSREEIRVIDGSGCYQGRSFAGICKQVYPQVECDYGNMKKGMLLKILPNKSAHIVFVYAEETSVSCTRSFCAHA